MRPLFLLLLAAACSSPPAPIDAGTDAGADAGRTCLDPDAGPTPDAGGLDGGDLTCLGQPLPTVAVDALAIEGFVSSAGLVRNPVAGALVELFDSSGALLDSATTTADGGRYQLDTVIGCAPLSGSVRGSNPDAGFFDIWYYPPQPWRRSRAGLELTIFDTAARNLAAGIAQVTIQNGTGALALGVEDCTGTPISGATVSTNAGGDVRYVSDLGLPSMMLTATTGKGQVLVFNVAPGDVMLTATVNGQTLRTKTVGVRADAITATTLVP